MRYIIISPGIYKETVVLSKKSLTLTSKNPEKENKRDRLIVDIFVFISF